MLSDPEKNKILGDGISCKRQEELLEAARQKAQASRDLDDYIAFLMAIQKIKPFEHKRVMTRADKNIL